jgi:C4-dicarboxylate-specific signal transduction histidine kinase
VELVEDALRINAAAFERHRVQVIRKFDETTPLLSVDRHKVLQVLINLFGNAKYAMDVQTSDEKRLIICIEPIASQRARIVVTDNGVGISAENLVKIFTHGFTTKEGGHGFGLHSSANAAKEIGGSLTAHSDGPGRGATFILELPAAKAAGVEKLTNPEGAL